jgi:hypothetical protein
VDTARHWLPPAALRNLLDGMAAVRLNVLHWHVSDAQSFPLALPRRSRGGEGEGGGERGSPGSPAASPSAGGGGLGALPGAAS